MSSCFQNAFLLIDTMATPITVFRERPCMPRAAEARFAEDNCNSVRVTCANGTAYDWYKGGIVQETHPNGDKIIFPARPTYKSFIDGSYILAEFFLGYLSFQHQLRGNYIEFKQDGSTMYRRNGSTIFWSPLFPAQEVEGRITYSICSFDNDDEYQFWSSERADSVS